MSSAAAVGGSLVYATRELRHAQRRLTRIAAIIEGVDVRCMAADGPVASGAAA